MATADLFPKLNLTGSLGFESLQLKSWFNSPSEFFSFGPSVQWRIFDAGQIFANIRVQNARQQEAVIQYRQAVLQSLSDVEDALTAYHQEQTRREALQRSVEANERSVSLAKQLNQAGLVDFLNVLTAEQSLFLSRTSLPRVTKPSQLTWWRFTRRWAAGGKSPSRPAHSRVRRPADDFRIEPKSLGWRTLRTDLGRLPHRLNSPASKISRGADFSLVVSHHGSVLSDFRQKF